MIATNMQSNDNFAAIQLLVNNNKGGGRAVLNMAKYLERTVKERVRGFALPCHTFARRYYNFASTAFHTLLDRYSKKTIGSASPVHDLAACFEAFATKFCRDFTDTGLSFQPAALPTDPESGATSFLTDFLLYAGPRTLSLLGFVQSQVEPDVLNYHYFQYMRSLQEKHVPSETYQRDLDVFSMYIDFFSKRQAKPDVRHLFEERAKAGQGISAFQKQVNALLSPYSRCLAEMTHKILLPNVVLASNRPDASIGAEIAEIMNAAHAHHPTRVFSNFACDFTEYDSSQYELSPMINSVFMFALGAPVKLIDMYCTMRRDWVLSDDMMKLYGHHKMHSGEPFTLIGNTMFGMFVLAHALDWDHLAYAAFKGDDSAIHADNIRFNHAAMQWCSSRGLHLKDEYPTWMEFIGMLVTPYGFFPDVVRRSVKFLSTVFRDKAHYADSIKSLDADLQCLTSSTHFEFGCHALSHYYAETGRTNTITPDHVRLLTSFLYQQAKRPFETLVPFDLPVFTVAHA